MSLNLHSPYLHANICPDLRALAPSTKSTLLLCPDHMSSTAPLAVSDDPNFEWALHLTCHQCLFSWTICKTCSVRNHITTRLQILRHNRRYHRSNVNTDPPVPSSPTPSESTDTSSISESTSVSTISTISSTPSWSSSSTRYSCTTPTTILQTLSSPVQHGRIECTTYFNHHKCGNGLGYLISYACFKNQFFDGCSYKSRKS